MDTIHGDAVGIKNAPPLTPKFEPQRFESYWIILHSAWRAGDTIRYLVILPDMAQVNPAERLYLMNGLNMVQHQQADNMQALAIWRKKYLIRQWLIRRPLCDMYEKVMGKLEREDIAGFWNFVRMDAAHFYVLLRNKTEHLVRASPGNLVWSWL